MGCTREIIPAWDTVTQLPDMDFDQLAAEYRSLKAEADEIEARRKQVGEQLQAILILVDQPKVLWNDRVCSVRNGGSGARVDPKMLVQRGVPVEVINECTVPGKTWQYFEMRDVNKTAPDVSGGDQ